MWCTIYLWQWRYISAYNPFNPEDVLEDITDEKELEMVNDVLVQIDEESI